MSNSQNSNQIDEQISSVEATVVGGTPAPIDDEAPIDSDRSNTALSHDSTASKVRKSSSDARSSSDLVVSSSSGPISLEKIRQLRLRQQQMAEQIRKAAKAKRPPKSGVSKSHEPDEMPGSSVPDVADDSASGVAATGETIESQAEESSRGAQPQSTARDHRKVKRGTRANGEFMNIPTPPPTQPKVAIPSRRAPLSQDLEDEFNSVLTADIDLDKYLVGDQSLQVGHLLSEGQRVQATVMKLHGENVFVSLGGPNEGVVPILQFRNPPRLGDRLDVVVRGFLSDEGLYEVTVPGSAVDVADWSELKEGDVIEALITGANAGGLECQVNNIRGFIPASQVAPYRVENLAEFIGQKALCVVTEANERRGNLVLSRRAVLEREQQEQKSQRLAALKIGAAVTGTVRKIADFGAFVDIGGLDGLLHISQLSWERVQHPSEVLHEGQQIQVRVDKIDPQTGKISLSYRSLQEHPWSNVQTRFAVGSTQKGTVTRLAEFGAFVKLATGVEGLVHLSELAHYRVPSAGSVVKEGQEVEVKVLAIDEEKQRISLSIKAAQPSPAVEQDSSGEAEHPPEVPSKRAATKHRGPLKGGIGSSGGGEQFGLKW